MDYNPGNTSTNADIDQVSQHHLLSISKWTKFIAMTGFFFGGIILLLLVTVGSIVLQQFRSMTSMGFNESASLLVAIVIVVMLVVFIWLYFLLRASMYIRKGLENRNNMELAEGFKALRIYFTISFIFSIFGILSTLQSFA
jgi:hypothetical protein